MERFWLSLSFILLIPIVGCNRSLTGSSTLTIRVPKTFGKVGALNALPTNRKACYGVSVTASDIPLESTNGCAPKIGTLAGFVEAGKSIDATVRKGPDRKIELYVFLEDEGQDVPCPKLTPSFFATRLLNTYLVGTKDHVDVNMDEVPVPITMNFPGESQNLGQTLNLPTACTTSQTSLHAHVSAASGVSSGTNIHLKAQIGTVTDSPILSGTGVRLYVHE